MRPISPQAGLEIVDAYVERHLDFYDPLVWADPEERMVRRKAFAELSTYLYFKLRCGFAAPESLHAFVSNIVNSKAYLGLMCRQPSEFLLFAPALAYPARTGCLEPAAIAAVREMGAEPATRASERVPYRYLDYMFCLDAIAGTDAHDPGFRQCVYRLSILSQPLLAAHISIDDTYALTHSLFYVTGFGGDTSLFRSRPDMLPRADDIDAIICRYVFEENMDVALELAIGRMIVSGEDSAVLSWCIVAALKSLAVLGHLPSPSGAEKCGNFPKAFQDWAERYHTTMVLGLALALAVGRKRSFADEPANADRLLRYGGVLSAAFDADIYESSIRAAKLLDGGMRDLPAAPMQLAAVARVLRRHIALVENDGDPGLLVDALKLSEMKGTPRARDGIASINRLARLVLAELERLNPPAPACR